MTVIAEPITAEPLWIRTRAMFARAVAALGDAAAIAAITALTPALRRRIVAWLCPLEHIVRKLLLAQAAELRRVCSPVYGGAVTLRVTEGGRPPSVARYARATSPVNGGGNPATLDPSRPHTWPARFSLSLPRDPLAVPDARAPRIRSLWGPTPPPPPQPTRVLRVLDEAEAPLRLARRFEALRRVLENPRPHAERLARLLARAVRRFPEIARRYLLAPARTGDYDPADSRLSVDTLAHAWDAPDAFKDSS